MMTLHFIFSSALCQQFLFSSLLFIFTKRFLNGDQYLISLKIRKTKQFIVKVVPINKFFMNELSPQKLPCSLGQCFANSFFLGSQLHVSSFVSTKPLSLRQFRHSTRLKYQKYKKEQSQLKLKRLLENCLLFGIQIKIETIPYPLQLNFTKLLKLMKL